MERVLGGRYRVERKLGEGGMAEVWLARDLLEDRPLALKLLRPSEEEGSRDYFVHEFRVLSRLSHPNLVRVYDFVDGADGCFYTCEFLEGEDLFQATRALDLEELYEVVRQVLEALAFVHDRGLVHYDVKPENVNVRALAPARPGGRGTWQVKLVDFGLTGAATTTRGAKIKGTVHYVAPEVAKSLPSDHRADLYSLGVSLYYVLTRKLPYEGGSAISIIRKHLEKVPDPPTQLRPDLPEAWAVFVLRLLEKDPARRYPTAPDALQDLSRRLGKPYVAPARPQGLRAALAPSFVGREHELAHLAELLPRKGELGPPGVAWVLGEEGLGKTRLVRELKVLGQLQGTQVLGRDRQAQLHALGAVAARVEPVLPQQAHLLGGGQPGRRHGVAPGPDQLDQRHQGQGEERAAARDRHGQLGARQPVGRGQLQLRARRPDRDHEPGLDRPGQGAVAAGAQGQLPPLHGAGGAQEPGGEGVPLPPRLRRLGPERGPEGVSPGRGGGPERGGGRERGGSRERGGGPEGVHPEARRGKDHRRRRPGLLQRRRERALGQRSLGAQQGALEQEQALPLGDERLVHDPAPAVELELEGVHVGGDRRGAQLQLEGVASGREQARLRQPGPRGEELQRGHRDRGGQPLREAQLQPAQAHGPGQEQRGPPADRLPLAQLAPLQAEAAPGPRLASLPVLLRAGGHGQLAPHQVERPEGDLPPRGLQAQGRAQVERGAGVDHGLAVAAHRGAALVLLEAGLVVRGAAGGAAHDRVPGEQVVQAIGTAQHHRPSL